MDLSRFEVSAESENGFRAGRYCPNLLSNGTEVILDDAVPLRLIEQETHSGVPDEVNWELPGGSNGGRHIGSGTE